MTHITRAPDTTPFATTHRWLRGYNAEFVTNDFQPMHLVAHDGDRLIGSLDGEICWGKLRVDNVIVHEDLRRSGVGAGLLQAAEELAAAAGCTGAYLDTMSFQALAFYRSQGYDDVGVIAGFENETTKHFMHKALEPRRSES